MNAKQIKFVKEMVKHGDKIRAYRAAYGAKNDNVANVNAIRLLKNATISGEIAKQSEKIQDLVANNVANEIKDEVKSEALSAIEKRNIVAKIARGEYEYVEHEVTKMGEVVTYTRKPTPTEVLKATEIDNRMAGDNAPDKVDHTTKGEKITGEIDYTKLSDTVLDELINAETKTAKD